MPALPCFALHHTSSLPLSQQVKELLQANKPVRDAEWTAKEVELIMEKMPNLLTSKPVIYLVNMSATDYARKKNKWLPKIHAW